MTLRVDRPFSTPKQFAQLIVGRGADGYLVRLGDVARIERGCRKSYSTFRLNSQSAVGVGIIRQSGANTLAVADAARKGRRGDQAEPAARHDGHRRIGRFPVHQPRHRRRLETLIEAAVLVVLVIFLFLGSWRATLIPAVTVPICLLGSFAVLWMFGFSINLLTLLAMVLAIGIVVDDAIVVLENIHHRIEEGEPPLAASFNGARQVGFAIVSTTLVVCAVFVPIMFISGQTGLLFRELAVAMIGAIAFSGFLALSLAPMLCSKLLRHEERKGLAAWIDRRFDQLGERYSALLDRVLTRPLIPATVLAAFLTAAGLLFMTLPSELVPSEDTGIAQMQVSAPEGTGFDAMDRYMLDAQARLNPLIDEGTVRAIIQRTPGSNQQSDDFNSGQFTFFPQSLGGARQEHPTGRRRGEPDLRAIAGDSRQCPAARGDRRPQPQPAGQFRHRRQRLCRSRPRPRPGARRRRRQSGIINLDSDYKESKPQLRIEVDTDRAGDLGVSVSDVSQALQSLLGSRRVSTYVDRGEEYRVIVQAEQGARATEANLASIYVRSRTGTLIPLSNLVKLRESAGARDLGRYNKLRAITLQGGIAPGYSLGEALTFLEAAVAGAPEVAAVGYRGESQSFKEAGGSIYFVFLLTIVIVYLLLAAQFESFVHPAVIITTVPLAVAGGVIGLALMGQTINLYSQVGIVMLVGLAARTAS